MPVRSCANDSFSAKAATGSGPVLDDEGLAHTLRQPLRQEARSDVADTPSRKENHQTHRPRRIGLRHRDPRRYRDHGSPGGQMQKLSAVGKFHRVHVYSPPGKRTVNTDPLPGSLVTVTSPPIMRASYH